jgi:hypothetical protein
VDSKFSNGQFLQTLTCVRMNNQQGQGLSPIITTTAFDNQYLKEDKKTKQRGVPTGVFDPVTDEGNNSA